jgi:hypothetical protein
MRRRSGHSRPRSPSLEQVIDESVFPVDAARSCRETPDAARYHCSLSSSSTASKCVSRVTSVKPCWMAVERVMRKKLARIKTSVPAAMERLQRIRVGRATVGQQTVPFLTNVSKPARECYEHLGVSIPRVADVAEVVTANL